MRKYSIRKRYDDNGPYYMVSAEFDNDNLKNHVFETLLDALHEIAIDIEENGTCNATIEMEEI